jgi:glycosyltransferase involved in cell wall biosynthesis
MVARLLKDKGVHEFIEAARAVRTASPDALFTLVGWADPLNPSAVAKDELEGWQREGLVRWLGKVDDVRGEIAQADVMVLPSYREGSPRSLLEGSAMGKPLIATNTVGCREVVEHGYNGLLVPVGDAPALAKAMIQMISDPEARERMGKAGRAKVEQEFDERLVINKTFAAYGIPHDHEGRIACVH